MQKRLMFILNEPTYFVSHRLPIAIAAKKAGYEVHVATGVCEVLPEIMAEGFTYHYVSLSRSGRNVLSEIRSIVSIYRLMKRVKPDLVHLVTIKPVIYGSIAARMAKVPGVVAAVSGLGYAFIHQYREAILLRKIVSRLYRYAFKHKNLKVIFQNEDDQNTIINISAIKKSQSVLIHGSGVNLSHYHYTPEPDNVMPVVVMAARLLKDKGVFEYIEAAKLLLAKGINARFWLAGQMDRDNPSSVSELELSQWMKAGSIEYLGYQRNMAAVFSQVNVVVLPSYREGLPRVLCEAAACGRAIVTTDVPGCRVAIIPGETGLLSQARDTVSLVNAIETLLLDKSQREKMGQAGRAFAEKIFDINYVTQQHLRLYEELHQSY